MFELAHRNGNRHMNAYNPFQEMEEFEKNFFEDPFGNFFNNQDLAAFKTDVTDEGDHYELEADLPGFQKKDIHLELNDDMLTIQAERHSKNEDKDNSGKVVRMERSYGSYSRQFNVSQIDTDHIHAAYEDGVLKLTLPKKEVCAPQGRTLEIE